MLKIDSDDEENKISDDLFDAFSLVGRSEYVSLYDVKKEMTRYSPAFARLFGFPEYISHGLEKWLQHIHPEDRHRYKNVMRDLLAGDCRAYDISYRVLLKDGSYASTRHIGAVIRDADGKAEFVGGMMINEGLTENTDQVTVLRNEYGFFQDLSAVVELKKNCVMLLIGIGRMSALNDAHGYSYGNRVLQYFSWILQETFAQDGTVYRMDGAKFAFLTETLSSEEISDRFEKVRRTALGGISIDGGRQVLVLSGGMISYESNTTVDERTVYSCLNLAYHDSKTRRNGKLVNYNGAFGRDTKKSLELINEVRNCIVMDCKGFSLRYQPIVSAKTEKIIAVEALLSWYAGNFGEISPDNYIPAIERDFVFQELGYWIFKRAMIDGLKMLEKNPNLVISINVAPAQITDEFLMEELVKIANRLNFPLKNLCFELTAHCRQIVPEILKSVIFELKKLNIRCLLDDFGGGVASIDFLQMLKPEFIKPEKKYISEIEKNSGNRCIVQHLTNMAAELGTNVCIKGVASEEIRDIVREFPIISMQGNFYSPPLFIDELIKKYFS